MLKELLFVGGLGLGSLVTYKSVENYEFQSVKPKVADTPMHPEFKPDYNTTPFKKNFGIYDLGIVAGCTLLTVSGYKLMKRELD